MNGRPEITIFAAPRPLLAQRPFEMCEHKGVGHPDTLADGACEAAAVALSRAYLSVFGEVLHFNVDKGLLVAGRSEPRFGGGSVVEPMKLIVCGRASNPDGRLDLYAIVTTAVREHLKRSARTGHEHFRIALEIREGSETLKRLYSGTNRVRRANDTSFGVGHAPLSLLERVVLDVGAFLRSEEFRSEFRAAGDDYKIMGVRFDTEISLTVALALVDRHVSGASEYFATKAAMQRRLAERFPRVTEFSINALDDPDADSEGGVYLTVTGLSAEMGDDGQVGRGNRVNGLITPARHMSLEAAAGKNPVRHVGKIYNALADAIAREVCAQIPEVVEASVQLVSRIGRAIGSPWATVVEIAPADRLANGLKARVESVVAERLKTLDALVEKLVRGEIALY